MCTLNFMHGANVPFPCPEGDASVFCVGEEGAAYRTHCVELYIHFSIHLHNAVSHPTLHVHV